MPSNGDEPGTRRVGYQRFMKGREVQVERADLLAPAAMELIEALNAELSERYPEPGARHFSLDASEVAPGRGAFFVAYVDHRPVGCGAIRQIEASVGEIKRMFVRAAERGRGVGRAVLAALEAEGRRLGLRRVVLETGIRQAEALALYERAGYSRIAAFGEYVNSPSTSICMAKDI
jgi:GNAT superfamily N-acetyltransferase